LEEIELGGRILLNRLFKFEWQEVKSTDLSQNRDNIWAFLITVLNIMFQNEGGWVNFFTFCESKLCKHSASDYSVHKYL
jgi:hypothetical protein